MFDLLSSLFLRYVFFNLVKCLGTPGGDECGAGERARKAPFFFFSWYATEVVFVSSTLSRYRRFVTTKTGSNTTSLSPPVFLEWWRGGELSASLRARRREIDYTVVSWMWQSRSSTINSSGYGFTLGIKLRGCFSYQRNCVR